MEEQDLIDAEAWHVLFNELCNRAGYFDDAALAAAYCGLIGNKDQKQFDTVLRNLNNWRSGRHLPRSGNLRILENLLAIRKGTALQARWRELHRTARPLEEEARAMPDTTRVQTSPPVPTRVSQAGRWKVAQAVCAGIALFCTGALAGGGVVASGWRPWAGPADNAPIIPFRPDITMKRGETRPIYAVRGDCGELPKDWADLLPDLPETRTGSLSDGGLARRHSKFCQGLTPARAIRFTASVVGTEEFEIQGDFFKMTVTE